MSQKTIWISVVTAVVFFAAGFAFANFLNRTELNGLRGENERLKTADTDSARSDSEITLSDEEIADKLAEAGRNPSNFAFQKNFGIALYRYGASKKDRDIIQKSIPALTRANSLDPDDYDVIVSLGHAHYDVGYFGKDNEGYNRAREFYGTALKKRKDDVEVRTDLGMTYFLQEPPDFAAALAEFEKSLAIDPKHEKTLAFAALALKNQGKDFSNVVATLRSVNPKNPTLKELEGFSQSSEVRQ